MIAHKSGDGRNAATIWYLQHIDDRCAPLRKTPVLTGNAFGFIGNRIYNAYRRQCEFMLEDGAWPEEVDDALKDFGFAMGPFTVAGLSGLDIAWRMRRAQAPQRDPRVSTVQRISRSR